MHERALRMPWLRHLMHDEAHLVADFLEDIRCHREEHFPRKWANKVQKALNAHGRRYSRGIQDVPERFRRQRGGHGRVLLVEDFCDVRERTTELQQTQSPMNSYYLHFNIQGGVNIGVNIVSLTHCMSSPA